jgi:hypothetical protein
LPSHHEASPRLVWIAGGAIAARERIRHTFYR